jgi:hypothetical protein
MSATSRLPPWSAIRSLGFPYAWFTCRWSNDVHYTSPFTAIAGALMALGRLYLTLPFVAA